MELQPDKRHINHALLNHSQFFSRQTAQDKEKLDLQLWYAADTFNEKRVKELLVQGADPARPVPCMKPPLHLLVPHCYQPYIRRICKLFLEYGADPNIEYAGTTPLIVITEKTNGEEEEQKTCWLFLHHGADPNRQDRDGNTALMYTTNENICNTLLQAKANVFLRNNKGDTALHWAARKRNKSMIEMILAHARKDKSLVTLLVCMKHHDLGAARAVYELQRRHELLTPYLIPFTYKGLLRAKNNEGKSYEDVYGKN